MALRPENMGREYHSRENFESYERQLPVFHPFPRLPLELRRVVWKLALPSPRLLELIADYNQGESDTENPFCVSAELISLDKHPFDPLSVRLVCKEYQEVFMENYERIKLNQAPHKVSWEGEETTRHPFLKFVLPQARRSIGYVDWTNDILLLPADSLYELPYYGISIDMSKVQNLTTGYDSEVEYSNYLKLVYKFASRCPKLKNLDLLGREIVI
jgi:hypothetical protein